MITDLLNKHHVFIYKSKPENTSTLAHFISATAVTTNIVIFLIEYFNDEKENERPKSVADRMF